MTANEYVAAHEQRLVELCYPAEILAELREARSKFLARWKRPLRCDVSIFGNAPDCESGEQGSIPGVTPKEL